jgi:predicted dehydrogenase
LEKKKKHRIVVFGLGSIGARLARLIRQNFDYDLAAFRSTPSAPNPYDIPELRSEKALTDYAPDIAFITNPTSLHMETAIRCASRGMHLFIEKPLSHRLDGSDDLLDLIRRNGLLTCVGCNLRFDPMIRRLKDIVAQDRVKEVRVISSSYLPLWRPEQDYRTSYSAREDLGGGVILDMIHEPDYCSWLFGKIKRIDGEAGKQSGLEIETEDFADMQLTHETGIVSHVHVDYTSREAQRKIEITGDGVYYKVDLLSRTLTIGAGQQRRIMKREAIERDYTYLQELRHFFDAIEKRRPPMNGVSEHLSVLRPLIEFKKRLNL